jgi:pantothenate kinase-related protein Tda10
VAADVIYNRLSDLIFERATTSPFLVGVAGAVAVGKTTIVRAMAVGLESRGRSVRVVSTDAFLLPNRVLNERGLLMRKGFPESYDHEAIAAAVERLAKQQHETTSELVRAALRRYIDEADTAAAWQRAVAYGRRKAKALGLRNDDALETLITDIVNEYRHGTRSTRAAASRR